MNEQSEKWDSQWRDLLTHCYGDVKADEGFKSGLLLKLKEKTAENVQRRDDSESAEDHNWNRLLGSAYVPCEPDLEFKKHLLGQLKARNTQLTGPVRTQAEEDVLKTILTTSYTPVKPRREFQTRLLENLKERQRNTTVTRRASRRRTYFLSAMSSMAAAAAVLFVVWLMPTDASAPSRVSSPVPSTSEPAYFAQLPLDVIETRAPSPAASDFSTSFIADEPASGGVIPAVAGFTFASAGAFRAADIFARKPLPDTTVRGVGMEVNDGDGWRVMSEDMIASVQPGMAFRPAKSAAGTTGLGFGDGATVLMCPDSIIESTEKGITVRSGTMAVTVPEGADERFLLHFAERDIAVEPGTMLAVTVPAPENYAEGGAPAPIIRVAEGGLALAKGANGIGPMLAGQVYRLDRYVTPDLPGRPICEAECVELEKRLQQPNFASFASGGGASGPVLASTGGNFSSKMIPAGFVQKGSRWFAKDYEDQQTVKIRYLSDDYFAFASERRDLAPALSLGAEVVIDGGDGQYYEIYK